jgi:hypothetical protein
VTFGFYQTDMFNGKFLVTENSLLLKDIKVGLVICPSFHSISSSFFSLLRCSKMSRLPSAPKTCAQQDRVDFLRHNKGKHTREELKVLYAGFKESHATMKIQQFEHTNKVKVDAKDAKRRRLFFSHIVPSVLLKRYKHRIASISSAEVNPFFLPVIKILPEVIIIPRDGENLSYLQGAYIYDFNKSLTSAQRAEVARVFLVLQCFWPEITMESDRCDGSKFTFTRAGRVVGVCFSVYCNGICLVPPIEFSRCADTIQVPVRADICKRGDKRQSPYLSFVCEGGGVGGVSVSTAVTLLSTRCSDAASCLYDWSIFALVRNRLLSVGGPYLPVDVWAVVESFILF